MRKGLLVFILLVVRATCLADVACPLKLIDGEMTQDGVRLTFRNTGKLPIQELELYCVPLEGKTVRRSVCRMESGLFYPGSQYDLDFQYGGARRAVQVSLKSAHLSDGTVWMASRHQACKPLKVLRQRTR